MLIFNSHDSFNDQHSHNSHISFNSHNSLTKFFTLRQVGKDSIC